MKETCMNCKHLRSFSNKRWCTFFIEPYGGLCCLEYEEREDNILVYRHKIEPELDKAIKDFKKEREQ